jgi:glycosyltransferase involved in cell wall biosynthesis
MKRLSIIVPIYNVEPFVEKCLQCLVEQDIQSEDYEIICINDGSPDKSRDIVIKFQETNTNIVLIDQKNQGVSVARNNGIEKASGKYLLFIDPDDYVDTNSFKRLLKIADDNDAQVASLGFTVLNEDESIKSEVHHDEISDKIVKGIDAYLLTHSEGRPDPDRIYGILFNRDFINKFNFRFLAGVPYLEDGELMTRILCVADRCIFNEGSFYWRTTRPGSATNSGLFYSKYAIDGFIKSAVNLREFRDTMPIDGEHRKYLNQPVSKYVILSISATSRLSTIKTFLYVRSRLKEYNFRKLDLDGCHITYQRLGGLFNLSISLFYLYMLFRPIGLSIVKLLNRLKKSKN